MLRHIEHSKHMYDHNILKMVKFKTKIQSSIKVHIFQEGYRNMTKSPICFDGIL